VGPGDGTVGPPNAYVIQLPGPWMDDFNAVLTYVAAASPDRVSVATIDHVIRPDLGAYRFDGVHYTKLGAHVLAETLRSEIDAARDAPPAPPSPDPPRCGPGVVP